MKHQFLFLILSALFLFPAEAGSQEIQCLRNQKQARTAQLSMSGNGTPETAPFVESLTVQPAPFSEQSNRKQALSELRKNSVNSPAAQPASRASAYPTPLITQGFSGLNANGIPNDNHLAVSDSGYLISVVNTNLRIFNDTGSLIRFRTLTNFVTPLGLFINNSDPRVMYDPVARRFILLFFSGNTSTNTNIFIAFSQQENPDGNWNFYRLPGNYLNDTTWSDYPIVTINRNELFMSFNHLADGQGWQTGFRYSAIWQIDLQSAYNGDSLEFNFWHGMAHQGKPVWSVCPVQDDLTDPNLTGAHFLSVRPSAAQNDTLFHHFISGTVAAGNAAYHFQVLKNQFAYGLPPNVPQTNGNWLATNDARVLCAVRNSSAAGTSIHYVQNSILPAQIRAGVFHGKLSLSNDTVATAPPSGRFVEADSLELAYPSLCVLKTAAGTSLMFTASAQGPSGFPGTVAWAASEQTLDQSPLVWAKNGEGFINATSDSIERWGDYTGIQTVYGNPSAAWLAGSYGVSNGRYNTWLARVISTDTTASSVWFESPTANALIYPVPAAERIFVEFELQAPQTISFKLYSSDGRTALEIFRHDCPVGKSKFSFQTNELPTGQYVLDARTAEGIPVFSRKLLCK